MTTTERHVYVPRMDEGDVGEDVTFFVQGEREGFGKWKNAILEFLGSGLKQCRIFASVDAPTRDGIKSVKVVLEKHAEQIGGVVVRRAKPSGDLWLVREG